MSTILKEAPFHNKEVLIIDNYDSFTYNLNQLVYEVLGKSVSIVKNDALSVQLIDAFEYIIISPGPGLPKEAGQLNSILEYAIPRKKILGVCLGLQAIIEVCGGKLKSLKQVAHGIESDIYIVSKCPIYQNIKERFTAGRYHSWIIDNKSVPDTIEINAVDSRGLVMGIHHKSFPVFAVQFHPESIMTPVGKKIIENFLNQ